MSRETYHLHPKTGSVHMDQAPLTYSSKSTCPVLESRPVVVIDPEDWSSVTRLMNLLWAGVKEPADVGTREMQAALRSLIAPPKPQEPTGLGAVVEDEDGSLLIRNAPTGDRPWVTLHGTTFAWREIDPAKILSQGVTL